jgi:hypothetical protein
MLNLLHVIAGVSPFFLSTGAAVSCWKLSSKLIF